LFLVRNEDDEILKVLDFGLAKWRRPLGAVTEGALTATDQFMGTPYYMSPEQMDGSRDADHRSDLWAVSVIAFECITGVRPYDGDNAISIALKVHSAPVPRLPTALALPEGLDNWFARALAKNPEHRFQSARQLVDELRRVCLLESSVPSENARLGTSPHSVGRSSEDPALEATHLVAKAQSAQAVTRNIDTLPEPLRSGAGRWRTWAVCAVFVVVASALLVASRRRQPAPPVEMRLDAAVPQSHPARAPEAPIAPLGPPASASVDSRSIAISDASVHETRGVAQDSAPPGTSGQRLARPSVPALTVPRQSAGPGASNKPVDIERIPTF
jgi:serine/threonine-protein kinase